MFLNRYLTIMKGINKFKSKWVEKDRVHVIYWV